MKWHFYLISLSLIFISPLAQANVASPEGLQSEVQSKKLRHYLKSPVASENKTAASSDNTQTQQGDDPKKKPEKKEAKKETENKKNESDTAKFEDRDGDGINDGKEHRFRKKSKRQHRKERKRMLRRKKKSGNSRGRNN